MSNWHRSEKTNLRTRAEARVQAHDVDIEALSEEETSQLLHELRVQQVELELQNEELRRNQVLLAEAHDRYFKLYDNAPNSYLTTNLNGEIIAANLTALDFLKVNRASLLHRQMSDFIAAESQNDYHWMRQRLQQDEDSQEAQLKMCTSDGRAFWTFVRGNLRVQDDRPCIHYAIIDIDELKQTQVAREQQRLLAEALRDSALVLNSPDILSDKLSRILQIMASIAPFTMAQVIIIEQDGEKAQVIYEKNVRRSPDDNFDRLVSMGGLLQTIAQTEAQLVIPNLGADALKVDNAAWVPSANASFLGIPLIQDDELIGFLCLYRPVKSEFSEEDRDWFSQFAQHISLAVQESQLLDNSQQLVALKERQKIAQGLHDSIMQMLFSSQLIAQALSQIEDRQELDNQLDHLHRLNRGVMSEMNNLLLELRSSEPVSVDLAILLQRLAEGINGRSSINVTTMIDKSSDALTTEAKQVLYRLTRQVLEYMVRFANAEEVRISLEGKGQQIDLIINHDGRYFDSKELHQYEDFAITWDYAQSKSIQIDLRGESHNDGCRLIIALNNVVKE
ncbi:MAG: hypothetical protein CL607_24185 [Anaerolineaceae bacterium]|nr:hypothetical protein [Anaerolineaceae bacterium]